MRGYIHVCTPRSPPILTPSTLNVVVVIFPVAQALRARNALDAMEALDENVSDMLGCLMSPNVRVRPFKLRLNCESTDPSATALTGADELRTGQHAQPILRECSEALVRQHQQHRAPRPWCPAHHHHRRRRHAGRRRTPHAAASLGVGVAHGLQPSCPVLRQPQPAQPRTSEIHPIRPLTLDCPPAHRCASPRP